MEEWENQKDTIDFSNYTDDDFLKLDDFYAMANMSHQTYEKFKGIKRTAQTTTENSKSSRKGKS